MRFSGVYSNEALRRLTRSDAEEQDDDDPIAHKMREMHCLLADLQKLRNQRAL